MKRAFVTVATLILAGAIPAAQAQDFDPMAMADTNTDSKVDLAEATSFSAQGWTFVDQSGAGKVKATEIPDFMQPSFATAKVDAEGFVTKDAFLAAVPARFKAADANADGTLNDGEMRAFLGVP